MAGITHRSSKRKLSVSSGSKLTRMTSSDKGHVQERTVQYSNVNHIELIYLHSFVNLMILKRTVLYLVFTPHCICFDFYLKINKKAASFLLLLFTF